MSFPTIAIVGGDSLLGREIREILRERNLKAHVQLIGADENETGKLTQDGDEAVVLTPLDETNLGSADVVVLAGSPASSKKAIATAPKSPMVDATGALEEAAGTGESGAPVIVPHPAALALGLFFAPLGPVRQAVLNIFEPASERGQQGIDELHQQTIKLFAFQSLPKTVFDAQLAYNFLSRFGEESAHSLERAQATVERHLTALLSRKGIALVPSLRLIQAPVFHAYVISAWVEFEQQVSAAQLEAALTAAGIDYRGPDVEQPTNVGVAGQNGIAVGAAVADHGNPKAWWFWIAADNLRLTANAAIDEVERLLA